MIQIPKKPESEGISARATIVRIVDGDTFEVSWRGHKRKIRPIGLWVKDKSEEDSQATKYLQQFVGKPVRVWIPTSEVESFFDLVSFDRYLAWVWPLDDDESISEAIVRNGWGTFEEPK